MLEIYDIGQNQIAFMSIGEVPEELAVPLIWAAFEWMQEPPK